MTKEKLCFLLKEKIRNADGEFINLDKEVELEVDWDDKNPSKGKIERQIIDIEKNNKVYKFQLEASIKKGWFKDKVESFNFGVKDGENFKLAPTTRLEAVITANYQRATGFYWIGGIIALIILGGIAYFLLKNKVKPSTRQ